MCQTCDAGILIHDDAHSTLAQDAGKVSETRLETLEIPKDLRSHSKGDDRQAGASMPLLPTQSDSDVAFYFHTSGTSSGLPMPIPQTHHGAVGILPYLPNNHEKATFTTTPLYHGGIADCFRAWTSGALIWLFPGKDVPITTSNISNCLECSKQAEAAECVPPVKYFSSVPYVLQMVASEPEGMTMLREMDVVGVGGAALPPDAGDSLVRNGVNLISRFGSAECGFLLSSYRDFQKDKEWQYLRSSTPSLLNFEAQQESSEPSELIIQPPWPHMAKRNREDGSFATADLFEPHSTIDNAWKYHSRADSQLTLITGKKFDPSPLEAAVALNDLLSDVLIVGNGKHYPGALLFRSQSAKGMDTEELLDKLWPVMDRLNKAGQSHTRVSRAMLVIMEAGAPGLEKSSKGTILRVQAETKYEKEIQRAYTQGEKPSDGSRSACVHDHEITTAVLEIIKDVIGTQEAIPEEADLFSFGVDSVACMAIRAKLQSRVLGQGGSQLPLNVVYDCGNTKKLSRYLLDLRQGRVTKTEDEMQLMKDLVDQYSNFASPHSLPEGCNEDRNRVPTSTEQHDHDEGEYVLLTGATGALGAHILHLLRSSPVTSHITCLVRAASPFAAHERVSKSLAARGKLGLPPFSSHRSAKPPSPLTNQLQPPQVTCLPIILSHAFLGLDEQAYTHLATTTTLVIHAAWAVNFTARLRSFEKDHIAGLSHLLCLLSSPPPNTNTPPPRFLFLSSTASVTATPTSHSIPECISHDPDDASPLGYSRSKWVAENICNVSHSRLNMITGYPLSDPGPGPRIAVLRIGQLCSDTQSGIWNTSEAWPLMLSTAPVLGALPDLGSLPLDWLPVDSAAEAVIQVAAALKDVPAARSDRQPGGTEVPIYHILNPHTTPTWTDLIRTIQASSPDLNIEMLPPREWLAKLEAHEGELSAKKLVGLWRAGFAGSEKEEGKQKAKGGPVFELERARQASAVMRHIKPLDTPMLGRMWKWIEAQTVLMDGE